MLLNMYDFDNSQMPSGLNEKSRSWTLVSTEIAPHWSSVFIDDLALHHSLVVPRRRMVVVMVVAVSSSLVILSDITLILDLAHPLLPVPSDIL